MARWAIPPAGVIAHSDMAPGRKADPGPKFDWRRLARGGRAVWAEASRRRPADWPRSGRRRGLGYARPRRLGGVLAAVRLRFRPWAAGALEAADVAVMRAWLAHLALTGGPFPRKRGARMAGWPRPAEVEESPDSRERWRRVTPARGDPRESATEMRPPRGFGRGQG